MHLVAKVFDLDITEEEVLGESRNLIGQDSFLAQVTALNRLIDRYLIFHHAVSQGISISEDEFDNALLETLEDLEAAPKDNDETKRMESRIRIRIVNRKYVQQVCNRDVSIADDLLFAFYEDQKDVFLAPHAVHAAHILIRADEPDARQKALDIRETIQTTDEFNAICGELSQCPTGCRYGDLGWFPKGRMIKEIEDVAFSLQPGQISDVFISKYGYHILLVRETRQQEPIPFDDIKDSIRAKMKQLEKEYFLIRHVNDLRETCKEFISILDDRYLADNTH